MTRTDDRHAGVCQTKRVMHLLRRLFYRLLPVLKTQLEKRDWLLLKREYYLPIPSRDDIKTSIATQPSDLPGLHFDADKTCQFTCAISPFFKEFREWAKGANFDLINGRFMAGDAHILYAFVRYFRPRRIVEIGSGESTRVAAGALLANGDGANLTAIEPYPSDVLTASFGGLSELIIKHVQDVDMQVFTSLQEGDILFIDSTHALKTGGDVQFIYCEILPRINPGVLVHIHDISLPEPYPSTYFDQGIFWNEQYMLQAFLSFNSAFEILWPAGMLMSVRPGFLEQLFPECKAMQAMFPDAKPTSFWIRRT